MLSLLPPPLAEEGNKRGVFLFLHIKKWYLSKICMIIIVVSGSRSGVGKTSIAQQLLKHFGCWSALKVTVSKNGGCPHTRRCGICADFKEPFYVIKDEETINQPGKDTARLKEAGAQEVIWLKARPEGLERGLYKALSEFSDCEGIIIEGTSVLKYIMPDINIHLYSMGRYKITCS
jgi:molybdopterin-guanine dinucleotide biosynthesis protein